MCFWTLDRWWKRIWEALGWRLKSKGREELETAGFVGSNVVAWFMVTLLMCDDDDGDDLFNWNP